MHRHASGMLPLALATAMGSIPGGSGNNMASAYGTRTMSLMNPPPVEPGDRPQPVHRAVGDRQTALGPVPPGRIACAAGDLERDDDPVTGLHRHDVVSNLDHVGYPFVAEAAGRWKWCATLGHGDVEIARRHGDGATRRTSASPGPSSTGSGASRH